VTDFRAQEVLDYWFGPNPLRDDELPNRLRLWFGAEDPPEIRALRDQDIATRFGAHTEAAARGELDHWAGSPHRLLALLLLLDQFPRQIWRGKARAFAQDAKAASLCLAGMGTGADAALSPVERMFFYLPLEHAEDRALQEESMSAYRRLAAEAPAEHRDLFEGVLRFAGSHREVVERFGRFPHRNTVLGRRSTPEELAYLRGERPGWQK